MRVALLLLLLLAGYKLVAQLSFGFTYKYYVDGVEVETVFKNGPADKAGLKPGDIILMVNDSVLRTVTRERIANVFITAPATSRFQLGYVGEDYEMYRGNKIMIIKEDRSNFLNKCMEGNCVNGKGKHIDMEGTTYEGDFKNGKRNGFGKSETPNGISYEGQWKDNKKEGRGKAAYTIKGYDFTNSSWQYEGSFSNDVMAGEGTIVYGDGSRYIGDMKANTMEGKGKMILKDSTVYEGDWKAGKLNGKGSVFFKNGDIHTGTFADHKWEGTVTIFTKATNTSITREYKNGKPI